MKLVQNLFLTSACVSALLLGACQSKPPRPAFVPPPPTGILNASEVDQAPRLINPAPRPQYPIELRRAGTSGQATVRFIVTREGKPIDITVTHATHPAFGYAASEAVAKWRYEPAIKDGQPIACLLSAPVVFSLNERR